MLDKAFRPARMLAGSRRIAVTHVAPMFAGYRPSSNATLENAKQAATQQDASTKEPEEEVFDTERDAALINAWKERQGSLANTEFGDGQVAGGYRRNVKANIFRYI